MQAVKAAPREAPVDATQCFRGPASAAEMKAATKAAQNTTTLMERPPWPIPLPAAPFEPSA